MMDQSMFATEDAPKSDKTYKIVRVINGVKSYLMSETTFDFGSWTRKKSRATVYDDPVDAVDHLESKLRIANAVQTDITGKPRFGYNDSNLYYERGYYGWRMMMFMYDLHNRAGKVEAKFAVAEYTTGVIHPTGIIFERELVENLTHYKPFMKNPQRLFSFVEFVINVADEEGVVKAVMDYKYQNLQLRLDVVRKVIDGGYRWRIANESPLLNRTAFDAISKFVEHIKTQNPKLFVNGDINYAGDGLSKWPDLFHTYLDQYEQICKANIAKQEKGIRGLM